MVIDSPDSAERVRTNEVKLIKTYQPNANVIYTGRALRMNAEDTEAVWQIERQILDGARTTKVFADFGAYTQVWADVTSIVFPSSSLFVNTYSTNFDGVNDYCTGGNVFNFDRTNPFSIVMWIRPNDMSALSTLYSKVTSDANEYGILLQITDGQVLFLSMKTASETRTQTFSIMLNQLSWQHVAITYDGSSDISGARIYVNSIVDRTPTPATLTATLLASQNARIGTGNLEDYYNGYIDEVGVFDAALTAAQVTEIFNDGLPIDLEDVSTSDDLVSYYRMGDGDTYPTITDNIGANNLTMTNMTASDFEQLVP